MGLLFYSDFVHAIRAVTVVFSVSFIIPSMTAMIALKIHRYYIY